MEIFASPPSPTLDALRITSRVAVRALLNPVSIPVRTSLSISPSPVPSPIAIKHAPVVEVTPALDQPILELVETDVNMDFDDMVETNGDVTPLTLDEPQKEEPLVDVEGIDKAIEAAEVIIAEAPVRLSIIHLPSRSSSSCMCRFPNRQT